MFAHSNFSLLGYDRDQFSGDEEDELYEERDRERSHGNGTDKKRTAEMRKSNKPIMEKRRRARINNCLTDLKSILLEAMSRDPARHSKLEKADILELTVKHLQSVQRQQLAVAMATDPSVGQRFKSGWQECIGEATRYMAKQSSPGGGAPFDDGVRTRLFHYMSGLVGGVGALAPAATTLAPQQTLFLAHPTAQQQQQQLLLQDFNNNGALTPTATVAAPRAATRTSTGSGNLNTSGSTDSSFSSNTSSLSLPSLQRRSSPDTDTEYPAVIDFSVKTNCKGNWEGSSQGDGRGRGGSSCWRPW